MSKTQTMAREMAHRATTAGAKHGLIAIASDVRGYARHLLHELELVAVDPVRVEVVLANGTHIKIMVPS